MQRATGPIHGRRRHESAQRCRNWQRWGPDDELEPSNFIDDVAYVGRPLWFVRDESSHVPCRTTPKALRTAATGGVNPIHFMLQHGGDPPTARRAILLVCATADDAIYMPSSAAHSGIALAYLSTTAACYNGCPKNESPAWGPRSAASRRWRQIVTRGVLLMFREQGLTGSTRCRVSRADLEPRPTPAASLRRRGDIVLVRTGAIAMARATGAGGPTAVARRPV